eukprot:1457401-Pleurochrysis_carterae.AAC.1
MMIFNSVFTSSVGKSQSGTGPSPSVFSIPRLRPISPEVPRVGGTSTVHRCGRDATCYCASSRCVLRGFVSENKLTEQHTKQIAADDLPADKEPRELSSLHTKHDVN